MTHLAIRHSSGCETPRPHRAAVDDRGLTVVLVEPCGAVTAPSVDAGDLCVALRAALNSEELSAAALPATRGLVAWTDARALVRLRSPNAKATSLLRGLYCASGVLVCGPLVLTGGTTRRPSPLPAERAVKIAQRLFGTEPVAEVESTVRSQRGCRGLRPVDAG